MRLRGTGPRVPILGGGGGDVVWDLVGGMRGPVVPHCEYKQTELITEKLIFHFNIVQIIYITLCISCILKQFYHKISHILRIQYWLALFDKIQQRHERVY